MRVLSLTSPPMKGDDVKNAQRRLRTFGAWSGKIDGVFGEQTARACTQAKWMLGYAEKNIRPTYGTDLNAFLTGTRKPTLLMQRRAKTRKPKNLGEAALVVARSYIGVKENPPNSNKTMFSNWYGITGPWCLMFVTYCFNNVGAKHFKPGVRWAYCPFMVNDARAQRYGLNVVPKTKVKAGDIALFDWKGDGVSDHVGIVSKAPNKYGDFQAIEGNTSHGNDSDGGAVMLRDRNVNQVICFVRVWE